MFIYNDKKIIGYVYNKSKIRMDKCIHFAYIFLLQSSLWVYNRIQERMHIWRMKTLKSLQMFSGVSFAREKGKNKEIV